MSARLSMTVRARTAGLALSDPIEVRPGLYSLVVTGTSTVGFAGKEGLSALSDALLRDAHSHPPDGTSRLTTLYLMPTLRCNLRCRYCHVAKTQGEELGVAGRFRSVLSQLAIKSDGRVEQIVFFGGEPLVAPDVVFDTCAWVRSRLSARTRLCMNTNATLLTPEIAARLRDYGVYPIVSLDGYRPEDNAQRVLADGTPAFSRVLTGMEHLRRARVPFGISAVVSPCSADSLCSFVKWAKEEWSVDTVGLNLTHWTQAGLPNEDEDRIIGSLATALGFAHSLGVSIAQYTPRIRAFIAGHAIGPYCSGCGAKVIVYPDGSLGRCEAEGWSCGTGTAISGCEPLPLYNERKCSRCPAAVLCGGGCHHDMKVLSLRRRWCRWSHVLLRSALQSLAEATRDMAADGFVIPSQECRRSTASRFCRSAQRL